MEPRNKVYSFMCRFFHSPRARIRARNFIYRIFNFIALLRRKKSYSTADEIKNAFVEYLKKNEECVLTTRLKNKLDDVSRQMIDLLLYRHKQMNWSYSEGEIEEWERNRKQTIPFLFPNDTTLIQDVFVFHNGLIFLPPDIFQQLTDGCVVDGGAASGDSALVFLEYKPTKVYAFEPSKRQISELNETIKLNSVSDKIEIVPYGLSDKSDICLIHDQRQMMSEVPAITLDSFCHDKRIALIKLDIEGAELSAVQGAEATIRRDRPILLISIYHRPEDFFEIKPLIDSWGLGYNFMIRDTEVGNSLAGVHAMLIGYCNK